MDWVSFNSFLRKEKNYKAKISYKETHYSYPLPSALNTGILMHTDETFDSFRISLYASAPNALDNLQFIGKQNGQTVCRSQLATNKSEAVIHIPKKDLETGLINFNLLDKNDNIVCERIAFFEPIEAQKPTIFISKNDFNKNELVDVMVHLKEALGSNMSVTVTESSEAEINYHNLDIMSYLLLSSEIVDDIEQPGYYLHSNDPERKKILNLLLITQSNNQRLLNNKLKNNVLKFPHESGISVKGTVKKKYAKTPVEANVSISYKNDEELGYDEVLTDSLGRFAFNDLNFQERTFVTIYAKNLKRKSKRYRGDFIIELDSLIPPEITKKSVLKAANNKYATNNSSSPLQRNPYISNGFTPQKGEIKLDAVKLNAQTTESEKTKRFTEKRKASLYTAPSHTLDFEKARLAPVGNTFTPLQGKFAGVSVVGETINIRGAVGAVSDPMFLIDGFPASRETVLSTPITDIDFIDIIKGPRTAIYGIRAGNGIVAVYTLDGSEKQELKKNKNVFKFTHNGYHRPEKFNQNETKSATLYWNPNIQLEENDNAKISFYSGHKTAIYKISIEGITPDGIPFKSEAFFKVK